jgi:hypothetical protein
MHNPLYHLREHSQRSRLLSTLRILSNEIRKRFHTITLNASVYLRICGVVLHWIDYTLPILESEEDDCKGMDEIEALTIKRDIKIFFKTTGRPPTPSPKIKL